MRVPSFILLATLPCGVSAQTISMPASVAIDDPVALRVAGLRPGTTVTLEVERVTPAGQGAASQTIFVVGAQGTIDPARDAPVAGYAGADPAGPIWSMSPKRGSWPAEDRGRLTVRVREGERLLASASTRLIEIAPGVAYESVPVFPGARLYRPRDTVRRPVVIVLGGSEGGVSFGRSLAPHLAALGYAALAMPYYNAGWGEAPIPNLPNAFIAIPVDRLAAIRAWVRSRGDLDADAIGLYGVSKGGEFAMLAATRFAWLRAVIGIVPSDVVWEGWGAGVAEGTRASFAWKDRDYSFTPYRGMSAAFAALGQGKRIPLVVPHLEGRRAHPALAAAARIPVERFAGAMLVAGGDEDATWPSGEMVRAIAERRAAAGRVTVALSFANAGHGLSGTGWTPLNFPGVEAQAGANARAQREVWAATLDFLARHLPLPEAGRARVRARRFFPNRPRRR